MYQPGTILGAVACSCAVAFAQSVQVYEDGRAIGGAGPRDYVYIVQSPAKPLMQFSVGWNHTNTPYASVLTPPGWSFEVRSDGLSQRFGMNTPVGGIAGSGPTVETDSCAFWYTTDPARAITSFTFGFDCASSPANVGWMARGRSTATPPQAWMDKENWASPVGVGSGPVHGPGYVGLLCSPGGSNHCHTPPGACGGTGVWIPNTPEICITLWDPVCGCNGVTYSNECYASVAGVSIRYYGACGFMPPVLPYDRDGDNVYNGYDNCPYTANPTQADADADFVGDACDSCPGTISAAVADYAGCPPVVKGDFDHDGDVDDADYTSFEACVSGPGVGIASGCGGKDLNADGYVDQADFGVLQRCISGQDLAGNAQCR